MAVDREKITKNAMRLTQKGQFVKAIAEYKKLLSIDPRDIRTRLKLLDLYGRAGKTAEAIAECTEVAESYSDQGFYLKAIAVYKQALRIDSENPALYQNMGEMYVKQGLVGDALGSYKKGVEVLRRLNRGAEAEDLLVRMEEMAPENAAIKTHLAELYIETGRFDAFEQILAKLTLQLRGEGRGRKLLQAMEGFYEKSGRHITVLKRLAELYVELGEEERTLEVVRSGLASHPADRDLRLLALRAYLLSGQLQDARRMALGLCEEDPDDLHILEQLASIAQARGDRVELAGAHKAMAKAYARKGLHQKEEECYRQVAALDPDDAEARLALGAVVLAVAPPAAGAPAETGIGSLWEGTHATPVAEMDVAEGLVEAELYLKYGMEEKAAAKLADLAEFAPDRVDIRSRLRDLYQRRGDRAGWVREQLHIAELFLRENRESEALRAYQSILEVEPGNNDARDAIQYLRPGMGPRGAGEPSALDVDGSTLEFIQEGGREQVVRTAASAVADAAEDPTLREGLAEADFYLAQELENEARSVLQTLLKRYPDSLPVRTRLERLGAAVPVEADFDDFVDLQAEILDAADFSLGSDFAGFQEFEVSELDDIVSEFKTGIAQRLDAGDFETHYNLGVAYREMGLLDDAMEEFQIAARSPDKAREAHSSMAQVYQEQGRTDEAQAALRTALAMPQNTAEDRVAIYFEIGYLAEKAEAWQSALAAYQKAAEIDPSHRDLAKRLQRARSRAGA